MRAGHPLLGCVSFLGVWILLVLVGAFSPALLPPPWRVVERLGLMVASGELLPDIYATLTRWIVGFFLGSAMGIPVGLLMGYSPLVRRSMVLVVDGARALPVISLLPLFLIFFGVGNTAKIAVTAWAAALAVLVNAMYGAGRIKELWLMTAKTLGATNTQVFLKVVVPGAFPDILIGLRIAVSHALVVVIAAEMMLGGGPDGLGRKLTDAAMLFRTEDVYAILCVIGLFGYASNTLFLAVENRLLPWVRV